jgi:hypothetical protein
MDRGGTGRDRPRREHGEEPAQEERAPLPGFKEVELTDLGGPAEGDEGAALPPVTAVVGREGAPRPAGAGETSGRR